jgi:CheY-like chemotaxis protein
MHLLIADDLTTQRLVLSMTLKKLGHTFVAAKDGKEAFGFFRKEYFPIVITDWQMPNMDGLELCRMIRAEPYEQYTYVVVLTTLDSKLNYLEALDAGANDLLVKPYDEELLAARLLVGQRIGALLTEVKQLRGLVPICPSCKKVRAEGDQWIEVRQFLSTHTNADVVQGTWPSCNSAHQEADRQLRRKLGRV